jgi:hypothetical protein
MTDGSLDMRLGAELADLGAHVAVPAHSMWARVRADLERTDALAPLRARRTIGRSWVAAAAAVVLVLVAVAIVSIAPARHAVADLLGIGATEVRHVRELPRSEAPPSLSSPGSRAELERQLERAHLYEPDPALVGAAEAWAVDPEGETTVAYRDVVLSQRERGDAPPAVKSAPPGADVRYVSVGDQPGLFVGGGHTRTVDGHTYRSTNALIWERGSVELRLEGDLSLRRMLDVARSVERRQ